MGSHHRLRRRHHGQLKEMRYFSRKCEVGLYQQRQAHVSLELMPASEMVVSLPRVLFFQMLPIK